MRLTRIWAALVLASAAMASTAAAQQCCQGSCRPGAGHPKMDEWEAAFYENLFWPRQYVGPARRGICQATEIMTINGWRRHNLLGKYHFEPNSDQLNEAGRLKTEWVLTQAPANRQTVYVQRMQQPEQTATRVDAVQQYAATIQGGGDVQETHVRDDGYPAGAVDAIFTGFQASRPVPALPAGAGAQAAGSAAQ